MNRRNFLKKTLLTTAVIGTSAGILITPKNLYAAWPKAAFDKKDLSGALETIYGGTSRVESTKVELKAPKIAENGAIVPINNLYSISRGSSHNWWMWWLTEENYYEYYKN